MKAMNYNKPEMEMIMLNKSQDVITASGGVTPGNDNGETPKKDFTEIWPNV